MTLRHQAGKALKWHAIEIVGRQCLSLVVFTTLARLLQPSDFGLVGMVAAYLAFINVFVDQGIGTALVQRHHLQPEHLDAAFWFNLASALVMCGLTIGLANTLARISGEPLIGPLLRWASLGLVINAIGAVQASIFVKTIDFKYLTFRTLVGNTVGGGIAIALAASGYGVWSLVSQQLIASVVAVSFVWAVSSWRPSFRFSPQHLWQLMTVSASVFATSVLWVFSSRIDQLVIGRFAGAATLGHYLVGGKLAEIARAVIQEPVAAIAMPVLSRVQNDYERLRHAIYSAMELYSVVCFAVFGGLASIAPTVVPLVFGEHWREAGSILQLVALYNLAVAVSALQHPALLASGGPGRYVFVNAASATGAAVACLVGIQFGVRTVVALLTLNMVAMTVVGVSFLRQRIGLSLRQFYRPCVVPAFAATLMFFLVSGTRLAFAPHLPLWVEAIIEVAVGAATYIAVIWMFAIATLRRFKEWR